MNKITKASKALNDNLNLLNEAKILELEAKLWDYKTIIFNQEKMIDEYKLLLMRENNDVQKFKDKLKSAQHVIDLMKIMLIGAEKQDFIIYPSSEKTPNYLDIIAKKIAEYEN